jgi:hypothetical protein
MQVKFRILTASALLALASCAPTTPTKNDAVAAVPAPTPERATFRKDVVIHSQPEGAAIYVNDGTTFVGNAPVTVNYPAYVDTGEFVQPFDAITAVPTAPGQFTQQQRIFYLYSNTTSCMLYMYNTQR